MLLGLQPLTTDLYLPALPLIHADLKAAAGEVQLTMSVLILSFGLSQLVWGPLADRYGRRVVLLLGLALYVAASVGCALAPNIHSLVIMRGAQGAAMSSAVVLARAMVRDLYEPGVGAQVMSKGLSGLGVIAIASLPIGGMLTEYAGWRAALWAVAVAGAITLGFVLMRVPETLAHRNPLALKPAPLLRNMGHALRHRSFQAWALLVSCTYAGLFMMLSLSSFVFIQALDFSPAMYGWVLCSNSVAYLLGTVLCRRSLVRVGLTATVRLGAVFTAAAALALLAVGWLSQPHPLAVLAPLWLYAIGHGFHQPCGQTGAVAPFPHMAGVASAMAGLILASVAFGVGTLIGAHFDGSARFMCWGIALAGAATTAVAWTLVQRYGVAQHESHR